MAVEAEAGAGEAKARIVRATMVGTELTACVGTDVMQARAAIPRIRIAAGSPYLGIEIRPRLNEYPLINSAGLQRTAAVGLNLLETTDWHDEQGGLRALGRGRHLGPDQSDGGLDL